MQSVAIAVRAFGRSGRLLMANQDGDTIYHANHVRLYLCSVPGSPAVLEESQSEDGVIQRDKCNHVSFTHTTRMK